MTRYQLMRLMPSQWDWLPWRHMTMRLFIVYTLIGLSLGALLDQVREAFFQQPAIHRNATAVLTYNGYLVLVIDRTRTTYCNEHPIRVLFLNAADNRLGFPLVLPLNSNGLAWPYLGRQKFGLMLGRLDSLPSGTWNILETSQAACHWYDVFTGGQTVITNPVKVTIP